MVAISLNNRAKPSPNEKWENEAWRTYLSFNRNGLSWEIELCSSSSPRCVMQHYKLRSGLYAPAWCEDTLLLCLFPKPKASSRLGVKNWKDLIRLGWMTSINHFPFEKKIFGVLKPPEKFVAAVRELQREIKTTFLWDLSGCKKIESWCLKLTLRYIVWQTGFE